MFHLVQMNGTAVDAAQGRVINCLVDCPQPSGGRHGNAFLFDRTVPHMMFTLHDDALNVGSGFTAALWVRTPALPVDTYACFLAKPVGSGAFNTYGLCMTMAGNAFYHSGTVAAVDNLTGAAMSTSTWHHLAMTWDGTTKHGYLDGVLDETRDVLVQNDTAQVSIGCDTNSGSPAYCMTGELEDVMLFDRPLSAAEVLQLAQP